jgi:putative ABC transport system permease protein
MIRNYFLVAFRNLWKNKAYAAVNIFGLSIAFAVSLLLFATSHRILSVDRFHKNADQLYQGYFFANWPQKAEYQQAAPTPLQPLLKADYADKIDYAARWCGGEGVIRYQGKEHQDCDLKYTDPDFLHMFSFPLLKGSAETGLADLKSIVISQSYSEQIFGPKVDAMGKSLEMFREGKWETFRVAGVAEVNPDLESNLKFDLLLRFENQAISQDNKNNWGAWYHFVYVQLKPGVTQEKFEKAAQSLTRKVMPDNIANMKKEGAKPDARGDIFAFRLVKLEEVRFDTRFDRAVSIWLVYGLLIIAGMILLIACINFINLTIGRGFTRTREVGMRKVLGAHRSQIVRQFWGEAFLLCVLALLLSVVLAGFGISELNQLFGGKMKISALFNPQVLSWIALAFLLVTLLAGAYPALLISRFQAIQVIKNKFLAGKNGVRNALIVLQFSISTIMIICTLVVWRQMQFVRNTDLGYNTEQVLSIPIGNGQDGAKTLDRMRQELGSNSQVMGISGMDINIGRGLDGNISHSRIGFQHKDHEVKTNMVNVSHDYFKTLEIEMREGRDFSRNTPGDSIQSCVINEAMAKALGEKEPLGQFINLHDGQKTQVIGVVKDHHYASLHEVIAPLTFEMSPGMGINYIVVRMKPQSLSSSMDLLKTTWKKIAPKHEFQGSFLNENINKLYENEERLSQIFLIAAVLTILLSAMGLFAIAVLVIAQRTKEIGVRKVLGASVGSIVGLLSKDFLGLVLIGIVIATPPSFLLMNTWLKDFALRISFPWLMVAAAGAAAVLVAFLTVSYQSIRAATRNPVQSIRTNS